MKNSRMFISYIILSLICLPALTLLARGGESHEERSYQGNHNKAVYSHHNEQHNSYNTMHDSQNIKKYNKNYPNELYGPHGYTNYGNYGSGGGYSAAPYPYPPTGSQPGMSDDSNALYQSQLHRSGESY